MFTKKLTIAYRETKRIVSFLSKRDWEPGDELTNILDRANEEIERIANQAVEDVMAQLEEDYAVECRAMANNEMTGASGETVNIVKNEQRKAQTDLKKIEETIKRLSELQ